MTKEIIGGAVGTTLSAVGTATQTNELLQTISLIITILGGLITFVIIPLVSWYMKAKQDGKITKEEIKEGIDIATKGAEDIKESLDKGDKGDK